MLGLVLADNLLLLFVFWELTSFSSYLLIGFDHQRAAARAAALQALLITSGGGLALLAGVVLLGQAGGSLEIGPLLGQAGVVQAHPLYLPILTLILLAAFTKSAQVPFHLWLPSAMEAPTPASAYLHSATMVKAVEQAIELFNKKGFQAVRIPVSHAFHTKIVAPASKPLRTVLDRLTINPPTLPLVANVTGDLYGGYTSKNKLGTTRFTVGVNNITDQRPPLIYVGFAGDSDASTYDYMGRYFYARMSQLF